MKALLFSVFANVITPSHLACDFIQGIKRSGTRTNEDQVTRDRGDGKDSTACINLVKMVFAIRNAIAKELCGEALGTTNVHQESVFTGGRQPLSPCVSFTNSSDT